MSDITPRNPKTPAEIQARQAKIRHLVFDMLSPVVAALFLILAILWPHTIFTCIAGVCMGIVLIRFANSRYDGEQGRTISERMAMAGGIVLILLAFVRLAFMILESVGVLQWPL